MRSNADAVPPTPTWRMICRDHRAALAGICRLFRSPHLSLQTIELLVSASARRSINKSDLIGLQFGVQEFEQIAPANCVDQHRGRSIGMLDLRKCLT